MDKLPKKVYKVPHLYKIYLFDFTKELELILEMRRRTYKELKKV